MASASAIDGPASLEAAAKYLGLTEAELRTQLEAGKTLAEIAKAQGKTVDGLEKALTADAKTKLDAAVKAGTITQAQADELLKRTTDHLDDLVNGKLGRPAVTVTATITGFGRPPLMIPGAGAPDTVTPVPALRRVGLHEGSIGAGLVARPVGLSLRAHAQALERPLAVRILERHHPPRVAVCHRGDDRPVGAVGLGRCARQHVVERAVGLRRVPEDVEQPRLRPAARERVEPVVEAPVRGELAGHVAGSGSFGQSSAAASSARRSAGVARSTPSSSASVSSRRLRR